jgi:hypothetical protein
MDAETKFRFIQARAYEIYCRRDPSSGTAEDDWQQAEAEIERIQRGSHPQNLGRAKLKDKTRWGEITTHEGEDFENPA